MVNYLLLVLGLVVLGGPAIFALVRRISVSGGVSSARSETVSDQILAESTLFTAGADFDHPPWDGHLRLASPTDGGLL